MGRPQKEINAERGKRLKILFSEVKQRDKANTQSNIAEQINTSQQVLSNVINGKANLTEDTAKRIINLFPEYRLEWLLCIDDFKTYPDEADHYKDMLISEWSREDNLYSAMLYIIHDCGYDVSLGADLKITSPALNETAVCSLSEAKKYYDELHYMIENYVNFHFLRHKKERS